MFLLVNKYRNFCDFYKQKNWSGSCFSIFVSTWKCSQIPAICILTIFFYFNMLFIFNGVRNYY